MTQQLLQFERRFAWLLLIPILLLIVWLGMARLNSDALWLDEFWTMYHAGGIDPLTLPQVWARVAQEDPWQAPGYFLLLNLWGKLVGWSELAARSLSLLFGLLAVAWTYRLGRALISRTGGIAASLMLGLSAYFIYFTHELRAYSLSVLLTVMMLWVYYRIVHRREPPHFTHYALLFGTAFGLFYTHYFAALTLVALGIYHLLFVSKNRRWWYVTAVMVVAALLFLPWVSILLNALATATDQRGVRGSFALTAQQSLEGVLYLFSNGSIALVVVLLVFALRRERLPVFVWFWTLGTAALLLVINERFRVILEVRYLLVLWPGLALLTAFGLQTLAQRKISVVILTVWGIAGIWNSFDARSAITLHNPHWHLPWHTLARELEPRAVRGDSLLFALPDWTWAVYHGDLIRYYLGDLPLRYQMIERPQNIGDAAYTEKIQAVTTNTRRLWLAYTPQQPRDHLPHLQALLAAREFARCETAVDTEELRLDLYGSVADDGRVGRLEFSAAGGTITYIPVTSFSQQADTVLVTLDGWHIESGVSAQAYSVALHLVDEQGGLVAQTDYGLPTETLACHATRLDTTGLSSGDYRVMLTVYAWETGQRLLTANSEADGRVGIGSVRIPN